MLGVYVDTHTVYILINTIMLRDMYYMICLIFLVLILLLKGLAQAKIMNKSVILFWLLNMTIWCKHVHRLELQKFF